MLTLTRPAIEEYAHSKTEPVSALLDELVYDERVDRVLLTIRDGLFLIRKR